MTIAATLYSGNGPRSPRCLGSPHLVRRARYWMERGIPEKVAIDQAQYEIACALYRASRVRQFAPAMRSMIGTGGIGRYCVMRFLSRIEWRKNGSDFPSPIEKFLGSDDDLALACYIQRERNSAGHQT